MSKSIFLGTFDPPHYGHYNCIKSVIDSGVMNKFGIDKIHIIPCYQNPNKKNYTTSFLDRYLMCCKLFKDLIINRKVVIDDVEDHIKPNYTYDLFKWILNGFDHIIGKDFWWIITEETLIEIIDGQWFRWQDLLNNNKFIIVTENDLPDLYIFKANIPNDKMIFVPLNKNCCKVHSTQIREKIKNNESIEEYTNNDIQEYILEHKLYL